MACLPFETVMKTMILALVASVLCGRAAADNRAGDGAMMKLAERRGCAYCHALEPGPQRADGLAPIGPAWREVAAKYQGQDGAVAKLTQTVMAGSNPYDSHWKGKVSGLAMPPNARAVRAPEAKRLVQWILSLAPDKKR